MNCARDTKPVDLGHSIYAQTNHTYILQMSLKYMNNVNISVRKPVIMIYFICQSCARFQNNFKVGTKLLKCIRCDIFF